MPESLTIGIPAYNEKDSIRAAVLEALETAARAADEHEVLVVDDASEDGTGAILEALAREHPRLRVVRHPSNRGIVASFRTLYAETRTELLFMNAADRQWRMDEVFPMLEALRAGPLDLVVGRRRRKHYTLYRGVVSWGFRILCELLFRTRVWDPGSIKLMREPIRRLPVASEGVFEQAERIILAKAHGYRVGVVDVDHMPRTSGRARGASRANVVGALKDLGRFWIRHRRGLTGKPAPAETARGPRP